jgi:very-short-patch-repair endonuclease
VVSYEANRRQPLADVRRSTDVAVTVVDGIRVTTVAQTLFDLLRCWQLPMVERAMDAALLGGKVTIAELVERQQAMGRLRRPGTAIFSALVDERSTESLEHAASELELLLHRLLRGLPPAVRVRFQATPPWWENGAGRVDAYIPAWRLVVEADGRRWHSRVADFDRDRWRDNQAAAHGHRVMRFTHAHLTQRSADALALIVGAGASQVHRGAAAV